MLMKLITLLGNLSPLSMTPCFLLANISLWAYFAPVDHQQKKTSWLTFAQWKLNKHCCSHQVNYIIRPNACSISQYTYNNGRRLFSIITSTVNNIHWTANKFLLLSLSNTLNTKHNIQNLLNESTTIIIANNEEKMLEKNNTRNGNVHFESERFFVVFFPILIQIIAFVNLWKFGGHRKLDELFRSRFDYDFAQCLLEQMKLEKLWLWLTWCEPSHELRLIQ